MNKFLVAVLLVSLVSAGPQFEEFLSSLTIGQACPNAINAYTVTSFDVSPFPPTKGSTVTSTSVGTFSQAETITGIKIQVSLNGRNFYQEVIPQSGTYAAGQVGTFIYKQSVPEISPKGAYTIAGGLVNSANQQISCWEVSFNLA